MKGVQKRRLQESLASGVSKEAMGLAAVVCSCGTLWLMVVAVAALGVGGEQVAAAVKVVVADEGGEGAAAGVREQGGGFIAGVDDG